MSVFEILAAGAYPIVGLAGFILGSLFGQKLVADVQAAIHGIEARLTTVESSVATSKAVVAIEHHAAATEKLAAAVVVTGHHAAAQPAVAAAAANAPKV
jgi:copper chaperone CopZ